MFGDAAFWHTAVVPAIVAVGNALTVMTADPLCGWLHKVELPSNTLTNA